MDDKDFRLLEERIKLFSDLCTNNSTRTDERIKGIHERIEKKDAKLEEWQKDTTKEIKFIRGKQNKLYTTLIVGGTVTIFIGTGLWALITFIFK